MDKRYQVFVSSTFADLTEERQKVIQALMEMDCIPAGMELFPAADDADLVFEAGVGTVTCNANCMLNLNTCGTLLAPPVPCFMSS